MDFAECEALAIDQNKTLEEIKEVFNGVEYNYQLTDFDGEVVMFQSLSDVWCALE